MKNYLDRDDSLESIMRELCKSDQDSDDFDDFDDSDDSDKIVGDCDRRDRFCDHEYVEHGTCVRCGYVITIVDRYLMDDNFNINKSTTRKSTRSTKSCTSKSSLNEKKSAKVIVEKSRRVQRKSEDRIQKNGNRGCCSDLRSSDRKSEKGAKKNTKRYVNKRSNTDTIAKDKISRIVSDAVSDAVSDESTRTIALDIFRLSLNVKYHVSKRKRVNLDTKIVACVLKALTFKNRFSEFENLLLSSVNSESELEQINDQLFRISLAVNDRYFSTIPFLVEKVYIRVVLSDSGCDIKRYATPVTKLVECVKIWTDSFNHFQYRTVILACVQMYDAIKEFVEIAEQKDNNSAKNFSVENSYLQKCSKIFKGSNKKKPHVYLAIVRQLLAKIFASIVEIYPCILYSEHCGCYAKIIIDDNYFRSITSVDQWNVMIGKCVVSYQFFDECNTVSYINAKSLKLPLIESDDTLGIKFNFTNFDRDEFYYSHLVKVFDQFFLSE